MDIGSGIAIGSFFLMVLGIIWKLLDKKPQCPEHSGICKALDDLDGWLNKIEQKLDRVIERRAEVRE